MKLFKLLFSLCFVFGVNFQAIAQDFSFTKIKAKATGEIQYQADVNEQRILNDLRKGNRLDFNLDGKSFSQSVKRVTQLSFGYTGITAYPTQGNSYSSLLIKDGKLTGVIHFDGTPYRLSKKEGEYQFFQITEETHQCSLDDYLVDNNSLQKSKTDPGGENANPSYNLADYSDTTTVDVLVLYTTNAKNWASNSNSVADIQEIFALNNNFKDDIIENSELALNIRFVGYVEIDNPTATSTSDKLENMRDNTYSGSSHTSDTVDVHNLREQYGADLVALVDSINDTGGLAYRTNDIGGNSEGGYSVSRVQQMSYNYVLMHELGHNFGNSHGRTQESAAAGELGGVFHFSTGHLMTTPTDSFVTVMHYTDLEGSNEGTTVPYFSNPRINYDPSGVNLATGAYDGDGGPSDNVLSMSITKNWVADYRNTVVDPPAISLTTTAIEDTVFPSGVSTRNIIIQNTGDSDLEIKLDGKMDYTSALKMAKATDISQKLSISYDFEESEGYETGSYTGYNNWISLNDNEPFEISNEEAFSGNQSLKITNNTSSNTYIYSPFFSTKSAYSKYKVSFRILPQNTPNAIIRMQSSIGTSGAIWFQDDNDILYYQPSTTNYWNFSDDYTNGNWQKIDIDVTTKNGGETVYNYDDGSNRTRTSDSGFQFVEALEFFLDNSSSSTSVYIDDIQITADDLYGPALTISDSRMTIRPGETDTMTVNFYGNGYDEGVYDGNIYLETNVPTADSSMTIPVDLRIDPNNLNSDGEFAIELTGQEGFRLLSAPTDVNLMNLLEPLHTQGASNADVSNGSPNVWTWDKSYTGSTNAGWNTVTDLDTTINTGDAFLVYVFNEDEYGNSSSQGFPKLLPVSGTTVSSATPTVNQNADAYTLVGNPYPSTVDWDNVYNNSESTELTSSIYTYDPNGSGWISYNSSAGTGDITNGLLKPFQGFFVKSSGNVTSGPSISFESNDITSGGTFHGKEKENTYARFEITDPNSNLSNSAYTVFTNHADLDKDHFDAVEMTPLPGSSLVLSTSSSDGYELDINSVPDFKDSFRIPVNINAQGATDNVKFTLTDAPGLTNVEIQLTNGEWIKEIAVNESVDLTINSSNKHNSQNINLHKENSGSNNIYELIFTKQKTVSIDEPEIPQEFKLLQNYPNPFNPSTSIQFGLPTSANVKLSVYNVLGQQVGVLVNEPLKAGFHTVKFDAENLSSGVYLFRIEAGSFVDSKKMILMK